MSRDGAGIHRDGREALCRGSTNGRERHSIRVIQVSFRIVLKHGISGEGIPPYLGTTVASIGKDCYTKRKEIMALLKSSTADSTGVLNIEGALIGAGNVSSMYA